MALRTGPLSGGAVKKPVVRHYSVHRLELTYRKMEVNIGTNGSLLHPVYFSILPTAFERSSSRGD